MLQNHTKPPAASVQMQIYHSSVTRNMTSFGHSTGKPRPGLKEVADAFPRAVRQGPRPGQTFTFGILGTLSRERISLKKLERACGTFPVMNACQGGCLQRMSASDS